jgi:hypothetical protein
VVEVGRASLCGKELDVVEVRAARHYHAPSPPTHVSAIGASPATTAGTLHILQSAKVEELSPTSTSPYSDLLYLLHW